MYYVPVKEKNNNKKPTRTESFAKLTKMHSNYK